VGARPRSVRVVFRLPRTPIAHPKTMTRKLLSFAAFALFTTSLSAQGSAPTSNPTADQVVTNYINARGGLDKIKSVKSERIKGTVSFGPDAEGPFQIERQRPLKMRMEFIINGMTLLRVYDGKSQGWVYNPMTPNPAVEAMPESDLRNIFDEADFDGPFVDYKAKGNQIEFVDKEEVLGTTAYKLKLINKLGDVSYFYFDISTNLLLKWEGDRKVENKNFPWESYFHDFRDVSGLKYPFLIDSDSPGTDQRQKITAEKVEINIPIDAARFGKPIPPAPPSPAEPPAPTSPDSPPKPN
jgi:outer membrane lipoprotein-sorting protein